MNEMVCKQTLQCNKKKTVFIFYKCLFTSDVAYWIGMARLIDDSISVSTIYADWAVWGRIELNLNNLLKNPLQTDKQICTGKCIYIV